MDIETLNSLYSHPGSVTFKEGPNTLPIALITTPHATAAISIYGAHLLSYQVQQTELLFLSENAIFKQGTPIRGGVPICWPWFGADPQGKGRSDHGFARTNMWNVISSDLLSDSECAITLELTDTDESITIWPHPFSLQLKVSVGKSLTLELTTHNRGNEPMEITQALHTYFLVHDIYKTQILGLDGSLYSDKMDGGVQKRQEEHITIDSETDRIYHFEGEPITLIDEHQTLQIESYGSKSAVVWNPWIRVCEQKADLCADDYKRMVCIETANTLPADVITLDSDQKHTLKAVYKIG